VTRTGRIGTRTAVVCSVADQAVAAAGNIAVLVMAARLADAASFAVFAMVYMTGTVVLGLSAAYVGQALVLKHGHTVPSACRSEAAFSLTAGALLGVPAAALCAALQTDTSRAFAALAVSLPFLLLQDTLRYCCSVLRLPHLALAADLLRLGAALLLLAVQPPDASAARLVLCWGTAALPALAAALPAVAAHTRGAVAAPRGLLARGHLGRRFVVEFGVGSAASQTAIVVLGLVTGPLDVGALRGAATLFGPLNVLCTSATAFGPPLLNRLRPGTAATIRATAGLAAALVMTTAGWTLTLLALPDTVGRSLLGDTWGPAAVLLPATGTQYAAIAAGTSALLALRVLRPRATLPLQLVFSTTTVALLAAGYALWGVTGAAWGLCAGSACKATASWLRVRAVGHPTRQTEESDDHDDVHRPTEAARVHGEGV
jgi:hypothetical protein